MIELTIKLNKESGAESFDVKVPTEWNELSRHQLLYIAEYWQSWNDMLIGNLSMLKARALLFLCLCNLKSRYELQRLTHFLSFVDENTGVNVLEYTDFIFKEIRLTKNLLPKIWVSWLKHYYGPQDALSDLTIDEFSFAFDCYQRYQRHKKIEDLNNLVFILYRPKNKNIKTDGELRMPFNHNLISSEYAGNVWFKEKQAVFLFFYGCLEKLRMDFKEVFKVADNTTGKENTSFLDTTIAMSGAKFGSFNETKNVNIYVFFKELKNQILEAERIEKELKK